MRVIVREQPYLAGDRPAYLDYVVFGSLMWARSSSPRVLLDAADPVRAWRSRMLDLFDGYAAAAPGYPD